MLNVCYSGGLYRADKIIDADKIIEPSLSPITLIDRLRCQWGWKVNGL